MTVTPPDELDEILAPLRKYSISIAFERDLDKAKEAIAAHDAALLDRVEKEVINLDIVIPQYGDITLYDKSNGTAFKVPEEIRKAVHAELSTKQRQRLQALKEFKKDSK